MNPFTLILNTPECRWERYVALMASGETDESALDVLGFKRLCCRRMFLNHVQMVDKLLNYSGLQLRGESWSVILVLQYWNARNRKPMQTLRPRPRPLRRAAHCVWQLRCCMAHCVGRSLPTIWALVLIAKTIKITILVICGTDGFRSRCHRRNVCYALPSELRPPVRRFWRSQQVPYAVGRL